MIIIRDAKSLKNCYNTYIINNKVGDDMGEIKSNAELIQAVQDLISDNGIKKTWLADQLGIANQNLNRLISKKSMSLDDANRILNLMGYEVIADIKKV